MMWPRLKVIDNTNATVSTTRMKKRKVTATAEERNTGTDQRDTAGALTKRRRNGIVLNEQQPTGTRDEEDSIDKEEGADEQDTRRPATHASHTLQDGRQGVARSTPSFQVGVHTDRNSLSGLVLEQQGTKP